MEPGERPGGWLQCPQELMWWTCSPGRICRKQGSLVQCLEFCVTASRPEALEAHKPAARPPTAQTRPRNRCPQSWIWRAPPSSDPRGLAPAPSWRVAGISSAHQEQASWNLHRPSPTSPDGLSPPQPCRIRMRGGGALAPDRPSKRGCKRRRSATAVLLTPKAADVAAGWVHLAAASRRRLERGWRTESPGSAPVARWRCP